MWTEGTRGQRTQFRSHQLRSLALSLFSGYVAERKHRTPWSGHTAFSLSFAPTDEKKKKKTRKTKNLSYDADDHSKHEKK